MGQIANRIDGYVEGKRKTWAGPLSEFAAGILSKGGQKLFLDMEPGIKLMFHDTLAGIRDNPASPPELKEALGKALEVDDIWHTISGWFWLIIGWIPAIFSAGSVQAEDIRQEVSLVFPNKLLEPAQVIAAWRRDQKKYNKYFEDLKRDGYSDEKIELLKFITEYIPGVQDIIRFAVREVYSPEIASKFGYSEDFPESVLPDAERVGLTKAELMKYWGAHWELPSTLQGYEMLRRGIITEDELKLLLRTLDIMPFWREKLLNISWEIPTRVDVRRFWEMRVIDEARLREIYAALGYHGRDLDDYVLWTKIYVDFPTLLARYKNGWISLDDVKSELTAMGVAEERAAIIIEEKIKKEAPERTGTEKDLTKTDIINGVKKGVITRAQGAELLVDLGYDQDEATYLLAVNIPEDKVDQVVKERELTKSEIMKGLELKSITPDQAREMLLGLRYTPANADFILDIYKKRARELEKADIQTDLKNAVIPEADAIARLVALGYTDGDAKILIAKKVEPAKEVQAKEASKADIVAGVKKGLITPEQGYTMLVDIGYSSDAATFILSLTAESSPFSPISYEEFKDMTTKYRQAQGLTTQGAAEELRRAAGDVIRVTKDVETLRAAEKEEAAKLEPGPGLPDTATARLREIQVGLHRAEAELKRVKMVYDTAKAAFNYQAAK